VSAANNARSGAAAERLPSRRHLALAILGACLLALVLLGAAWADDFGEAWDVGVTARLGRLTLQSYRTLEPPSAWDRLGDMRRHGPVATALTEWATGILKGVWPGRAEYQVRNFVLFLWFVLGIACVYGLAIRWVGPGAALVATALMASQPLLFGHGFINPSDGPFLMLFAAVMLAGYGYKDALDRYLRRTVDSSTGPPRWTDLRLDWLDSSIGDRRKFLLWSAFFLAVAVELLLVHRIIFPVLMSWLRAAYHEAAWPPINALFRLLAEDADRATLDAYYTRLWLYYSTGRWLVLAGLAVPIAFVLRKILPRLMTGFLTLRPMAWAAFGGATLGVATSVRLVAPLAGLLVTLMALARGKYRALGTLLVYWGTAAVVCYVSWPSLWRDPWTAGLEFLRRTAFDPFNTLVLFGGRQFLAGNLPWDYLPTLMVLQTTLPAVILGGVGAWFAMRRPSEHRMEILATALWILVPVGLAVALGSTVYDNGRHYLFARTPWFLFAALGFDRAWAWRKSPAFRVGLSTIVLLPGLVGILRLHPYEYIYFNELAGGVPGAFRRYELDYWATSYREAMDYINREAPVGAVIAVGKARGLFGDYARADLRLAPEIVSQTEILDIDFAMTSTRADWDLVFFPDAPIVFRVEVDGAILAVVRDLR